MLDEVTKELELEGGELYRFSVARDFGAAEVDLDVAETRTPRVRAAPPVGARRSKASMRARSSIISNGFVR